MKVINPDLNREEILQAKLVALRRGICAHVGQNKRMKDLTHRIVALERPLVDVLELLQWHLDRLGSLTRKAEENSKEGQSFREFMNIPVELPSRSWNDLLEVLKEYDHQTEMLNRIFHKFKELPIELRLQIWDHAFEEDLQPRDHKLRMIGSADGVDHRLHDNVPIDFKSNQPINLLVHVCRESRAQYLFRTGATFAFKTLVKFDVDTIHLPLSLYAGIWLPDWETPFKKFTRSYGASLIRKLALPSDYMWMQNGDDWLCEPTRLRRMLPLCEQITWVFFNAAEDFEVGFGRYEERNASEIVQWKNIEGDLVKFSAREERSLHGLREFRSISKRQRNAVLDPPMRFSCAAWRIT